MIKVITVWLQRVFLGASVVIIILWGIEPIRNWLGIFSWVDKTFIYSIIALSLTLVFLSLEQIKLSLNIVLRSISNSSTNSEDIFIIEDGVSEVYPYLLKEMKSAKGKSEKTLQVLGLSLYTAWPHISTWLSKHEPEGWTIELCVIAALYSKNDDSIQDCWGSAVTSQLEAINQFKENDSHNKFNIQVYEYHSMPAIHGFKVGTGATFISFSHWNKKLTEIDDPVFFYEYFKSNNVSARSNLYRNLFMSWFNRAKFSGNQGKG